MTEPYEPYGAEWQARPPREKANQIITDLNERIERALIEALGTLDLLGIGDGVATDILELPIARNSRALCSKAMASRGSRGWVVSWAAPEERPMTDGPPALTAAERREANRLRSERWRRAHGIGPRRPPLDMVQAAQEGAGGRSHRAGPHRP
jgi:hypothetical protein